MKRYFDKKLMLAPLLGVALVGLVVPSAMARMGANQPCGNCHTMHNSQNGNDVNDGDDAAEGSTSANSALLIEAGCVACHTGDNTATSGTPYVYNTAASYDLAGGNFADVVANSLNGHDVFGISGPDTVTGLAGGLTPPGGSALTSQLTCAGAMGCHGERTGAASATQFGAISGGHHGKASTTDGTMNGGDLVNSYRMLLGVKGVEDYDWEKSVSATDHNQYYGIDRTAEDTSTVDGNGNPVTISALCAACHGEFHADVAGTDGTLGEAMANPWIRHPTDFDMADSGGEYAYYNGADGSVTATAAYNWEAPVASNGLTLLSTVNVGTSNANDTAIVTCVSCHRVHGSPNADMLRWDYSGMIAHGGAASAAGGCFTCHTTKDDI